VGEKHEPSSLVGNQIGTVGRRAGLSTDAHGHNLRDGRIHSDRENTGAYLGGAKVIAARDRRFVTEKYSWISRY
jgi:hypothetical protein